MLSEIFILRLEAMLRANALVVGSNSDLRFIPIRLPANSDKEPQRAAK